MKHEKTERLFRLRYKMICVLLLGIGLSVLLFFSVMLSGESLIGRFYMSERAVAERQKEYADSFERYVRINQLSIRDVSLISDWVQSKKNVYLIIYDGDDIVYESGWWDEKSETYTAYVESSESEAESEAEEKETQADSGTSEDDSSDPLQLSVTAGETENAAAAEEGDSAQVVTSDDGEVGYAYSVPMRDIEFAEGTFSASVIEFSEMKWYYLVEVISWTVMIITILTVLLFYNRYITNRIIRLSDEVSEITGGKWEEDIHCSGKDEISQLATDVDNLRDTMLKRLESEKAAWNVNSELITSMSHDIRTPLTTLIGYLDILDSGDYRSAEEMERYIGSCKQKALQLKDLSDKMFQYFLVFGRDSIDMDTETYDTEILLQQLLGEEIFYLSSMGFRIRADFTKRKSLLTADIHYLKRLFDNLFSNIRKYASPQGEVALQTKIVGEGLLICLANEVRKDDAVVESTNIGLKTCQKIVEQMGGRFAVERGESHFEVRIILPVELTGGGEEDAGEKEDQRDEDSTGIS